MDIQYIKNLLQSWFSFPKNKIYCQVSTVANRKPHIRTMDLYDVTDDGHLILLTDTSTRKWLDLQKCNNIAICIVHIEHGQIIVEGEATLKTSINDFSITSLYWHDALDQYWRDIYLSRSSNAEEKIPSSFGIIVVKPNFWEMLEINKQDYLRSLRKRFQLIDGTWTVQDMLAV